MAEPIKLCQKSREYGFNEGQEFALRCVKERLKIFFADVGLLQRVVELETSRLWAPFKTEEGGE